MIAAMVTGALGKNLMGDQASERGGGLGDIRGQVLGAGPGGSPGSSGGGLGDILGQVLGGGGSPAPAARASGGGTGDLGALLDELGSARAGGTADGAAAAKARDRLDTVLGGKSPKGAAGDKMLDTVKRDLGHA